MNKNYTPTTPDLFLSLAAIGQLVNRYWFQCILAYLSWHLFFHKDVSMQVQMNGQPLAQAQAIATGLVEPVQEETVVFLPAQNISQYLEQKEAATPRPHPRPKLIKAANEPTFSLSNLTPALSPNYAKEKGIDPALVEEKLAVCQDYVEKFAPMAVRAMQEHGIPASITLAQGLLESNAGNSKLARESNNHFGIKCRSKCRGCTCRNYTDDDVYDMFRVFSSSWDSYLEHAELLTSARYRHLKKFGSDYKSWAYGLKKAGYATDKTYAQKLIRIIENLKLHQYDGRA
jgi:flagellum-specific peptidoglycan hydrolase FlgJ